MNKDDEDASAEIMAAFSAIAPGMSGPFDGCLDLQNYDHRSDTLWSDVHKATEPNPWRSQATATDLVKQALRRINREYAESLHKVNDAERQMRLAVGERDMFAHNARTLLALLRKEAEHE